jgi:type IV pilus assembly protein PilW
MKHLPHRALAAQRGLTLVELLVAMTIGLVVTLAVTSIVTVGEAHKRDTISTNDMGQSGAYASYVIDRAVRSAGSGFTQSWDLGIFGCKLGASRAGAPILPRTSAFPGAFAGFLGGSAGSNNLRIAPLLIGKNQSSAGSDLLVVMGGNSASGDVSRPIRTPGSLGTNELRLDNIIGIGLNDVGLISQNGITDCVIEQVGTPDPIASPEVLPLAGTYYTTADPYTPLRASGSAYLTLLGNTAAQNLQFQVFGVGDDRTLFSYDLLRATGDGSDAAATQAIADGVVALHALYGIDTDDDGIFNEWVNPSAAGYDIATMMTDAARAKQVVAARVALVLRGSHYEKEVEREDGSIQYASPDSLVLFGDLPEASRETLNLSTDDRHYRYRVVDTVIPLRNVLLLPTP